MIRLNKDQIRDLLPHREPMLLIDELYDIKRLFSATAVVDVKKNSFFVQGHFPDQPVMPGVLIVESFGQAAAALTAHGLDKSTYQNKLVFLMGVEKAEAAKELAYSLYDIATIKRNDAKEATAYNGLIASWGNISSIAAR